jgi:hypothetical protein
MQLTRSFLESLLRLNNCASKDESRIYMNGVNIKPISEGVVEMAATNGYILSTCTEFCPLFELKPDIENMIFDRFSVQNLKSLLKEYKTRDLFDFEFNGDYQIVLKVGEKVVGLLDLISREYINYKPVLDKILNRNDQDKFSVILNIDYLYKVFESLKTDKKDAYKGLVLTFDKNNDMQAIEVKIKGKNNLGVIMPIKKG